MLQAPFGLTFLIKPGPDLTTLGYPAIVIFAAADASSPLGAF